MSPMSLTMQGRKEQYDQLDDHSAAAEERVLAWRRASVAGMKTAFAYDRLDDDGKTSFDIWSQELDRAERSHAFSDHGYVFDSRRSARRPAAVPHQLPPRRRPSRHGRLHLAHEPGRPRHPLAIRN